jgi:uncharacterized protein (TIGR00255 family)
MTGFGTSAQKTLMCEIRSVNHRFFNLKFNLPQTFSSHETPIEQMIRTQIERGSLHVTLSCRPDTGPRLAKLYHEMCALKKRMGFKEPLAFEAFLALPFLWNSHETASIPWPTLKPLIFKALKNLLRMRSVEGRSIQRDLEKRIQAMNQLLARVRERAPLVERTHMEKLAKRFKELTRDQLLKEGLDREVAQALDKSDIAEEIQRLGHHIEQFSKCLKLRGAIGRRLDFLTQEMVRETNTIASKAADVQVTDWIIETKSHLERIKEQVENVE